MLFKKKSLLSTSVKICAVSSSIACLGLVVSCVAATSQSSQQSAQPMAKEPAQQVQAAPPAQVEVKVLPAPGRTKTRKYTGVALTEFVSDHFIGSSKCGTCHDLLVDSAGKDMSITNHWRSTMMANASIDPLWLAKVSSEVARTPGLKDVIEAKCAACHMPMAATEAKAKKTKVSVFGEGFLNIDSELHQAAMDGVSCSLCHQIQDKDLGEKASFSANYKVDTTTPAPDRKTFGPYKETVKAPMKQSVGYDPAYGAHTNDSALCATCHTLYTPYVDAAGNVVGEFPEQTPYLEWKHSDFGVNADKRYDIGENPGQGLSCQECHMPLSKAGGVKIANYSPPEATAKDHFSQHHFVGGNVFMLNMFQDNVSTLRITASSEKFEDTKQRTIRLLQNETADVAIADVRRGMNELTAEVVITNKVGHKYPSGFPTRSTFVHMTVTASDGQVVFESGKPQPNGLVTGNNGDEQIGSYEPHHDMITSPDQVQIYEAVMANTDGEVTHTLLRAASYLKDNRMLPRGFDKNTAPKDIAVFGKAVEDDDFVGGSDRISYKINTKGFSGPFNVKAELLYHSLTYSSMQDMKKDSGLSKVGSFIRLYDKADKRPTTIAVAEVIR